MPSLLAGRRNPHRRQRGAALLLFMLIVVIGASYMLLSRLNARSSSNLQNDRKTVRMLKEAKEALIARAASDDNLPGSLPCPDNNGDGVADLFAGNECPAYLGRLPYRTLELEELRDGADAPLWYALSPNYRDYPLVGQPLNSNTPGQLKVDAATDIVAVILAPGEPFDYQDRSASPDDGQQYLEGVNADSDTTTFTAKTSSSLNDHIAFITRAELMKAVEKRVTGEVRKKLEGYYAANSYYPYAALLGSKSPDRRGWENLRRGFLPIDAGEGECKCKIKMDTIGISQFRWIECSCRVDAGNPAQSFILESAQFNSAEGDCTLSGPVCTCDLDPGQEGKCKTTPLSWPGPAPDIDIAIQKGIFTEEENGCSGAMTPGCTCGGGSTDGECKAKVAAQGNPPLAMPAWFTENEWDQLIYYSVSRARSESGGGPLLQVGGLTDVGAVVIAVGPELSGTECNGGPSPYDQTGTRTSKPEDPCSYLDTQENTDDDDVYTEHTRPVTDGYWDRIEIVRP